MLHPNPSRLASLSAVLLLAATLPFSFSPEAQAQGNAAPVANPDTVYIASARGPSTIPGVQVIGNDTDADPGAVLKITNVRAAEYGTVRLTGSGDIIYTPKGNFQGRDEFEYEVTDGALTSLAKVTVINQVANAGGIYAGLFEGVNKTHNDSGYAEVVVSNSGVFTAVFRVSGEAFRFRGVIGKVYDRDGTELGTGFKGIVVGRDRVRREILMLLALDIPGSLDVTISGGAVTSDFTISRVAYGRRDEEGKIVTAPHVGNYTIQMPPSSGGSGNPKGTGYAVLRVNSQGRGTLVGKLGDASAFSSSTYLDADAKLPVYTALYRQRGSIRGLLTFKSVVGPKAVAVGGAYVSGAFRWSKPAGTGSRLYRRGFSTDFTAAGGIYVTPSAPLTPLNLPGGSPNITLVASGDGLRKPRQEKATLQGRPVAGLYEATFHGNPKYNARLRIDAIRGTFSGKFFDPTRRAWRNYNGVFIQSAEVPADANKGYGVFPGGGTCGEIRVIPNPVTAPAAL